MHITRRCTCARRLALSLAACFATACRSESRRQFLSNASRESLSVAQRVDHADTAARETAVVQHPDGTLFVAGYGGPWARSPGDQRRLRALWRSRLWRSTDGGASWRRVDVGPRSDGVIGNSDVDLAIAPDSTLYFVTMTYDVPPNEGSAISIGVSRDAGATWTWRVLDHTRHDDRPWVRVAPNGTAHVIWNDGKGVQHVMSRDRGATWTEPARVFDRGGSSHLAVGPSGEVAVRVSPVSASGDQVDSAVNYIAISTDGKRWTMRAAPNRARWSKLDDSLALGRWVEPVAWDARGRLYSFWGDSTGAYLARSADRGATWKTWRVASCAAACFFPYLAARGDGDLAATWFDGDDRTLHWRAARVRVAGDSAAPAVVATAPLAIDAWWHPPEQPDKLLPDTGGEYLAAVFLLDGTIGVATAIQGPERNGFTWWRLR